MISCPLLSHPVIDGLIYSSRRSVIEFILHKICWNKDGFEVNNRIFQLWKVIEFFEEPLIFSPPVTRTGTRKLFRINTGTQ